MINFKRIVTNEDIEVLAKVTNEVWHEYFPCILSGEQIDYMVEKFQSAEAMSRQMQEENYQYYFICDGETVVGYTGIAPYGEEMFLSKLYLLKEFRGKGYGSEGLKFVVKKAKEHSCKKVYLTVNKYNDHSIKVYEHFGFKNVRSQVADIGNGYVMDDYVFEYEC